MAFLFSARSVRGLRDVNEDCYCAERIGDYYILGVADGLGGHAAGDRASSIAIECLRNAFRLDGGDPKESLQEAVSEADRQILIQGERFPESRGMATTLVAAAVDDNLDCTVINVGDCRAQVITADDVTTTLDHTYVNQLAELGVLQTEELWRHPLSNVLCQAIGDPEEVLRPDFYTMNISHAFLLLSSDGFHDFVRKETIREMVIGNRDGLERICEDLVARALDDESDDNITVVLACESEGIPEA